LDSGLVLLLKLVTRIYALCKTVTGGGASGSTEGTGGSVNPLGMVRIFRAMRIQGRNFVDLGAGDGRVLAAAAACGAHTAWGCELPGNTGCIMIFNALMAMMPMKIPGILTASASQPVPPKCVLAAQDIDTVAAANHSHLRGHHRIPLTSFLFRR
jgi:hypothetical protein